MKPDIKPHLLLLHGALGSKSQFDSLTELLAGTFNVHAINFSGHGGEKIPVDGYSILLFENDVLDYMNVNEIGSAFIFGYSMGGYVGLSLAGIHPDKVRSVYTLATKLEWNPEVANKESGMLNPETILEKIPKFAKQLEERHHPADWKQIMQKTAAFMKILGDQPLDEKFFRTIHCPVMLSVGDRDKMVGVSETFHVFKFLTRGSLYVMPQTNHPFEMVDHKRLALEIIRYFNF